MCGVAVAPRHASGAAATAALQPLGAAQLRVHLSRGARWLYKQRTMTTTFQPDTRAVPSSSGWEGLHLEQDLT